MNFNQKSISDLKLSVHHVGGRAGSRAFPYIKKFEKDFINVLYDADEDCLEQVKHRNRNFESELHVLPYALSDKCKPSVLNINYDPYTSSLLETNNSIKSFYLFEGRFDYIFGEVATPIEKRDINVVSIDHLYKTNTVSIPKPDFLSIDVEGVEFDILKGAIETMNSSVLAVFAEINFLPFRHGQKNLGELSDFLSTHGFHFVSFANSGYGEKIVMEKMAPYRYPVGLRGDGFHTCSEVLFLRKIEIVENIISDNLMRYINLRKLAFIAFVFNQTEYGLECLKHSRMIDKHSKSDLHFSGEVSYLTFLSEIELAEKKHPKLFPKTFKAFYSQAESKKRFLVEERKSQVKKSIVRDFAKNVPGLRMIYRLILKTIYGVLKLVKKKYSLITLNSDFEKVFIKFGLTEQACLIRKKRIEQQPHVSK
jgi:FkbM family methyltransferase